MKNISKGTVIRTAVLVLAIFNNGLAIAGKSPLPIDSEIVTEVISFLFTTAAAFVAWWKNNSFTQAAIEADSYMQELKG
ncbi:MAG: phage holin [Lachnospiraceae bacterium]